MKTKQDPENTSVVQKSLQAPHESQGNGQNSTGSEDLIAESGSISNASNEKRKVSREDIELVQNLIERCLQLYMNKGEVVKTLSSRARIEPGFTNLVNSFHMGYPILQQPPMPATGQPPLDHMSCRLSSSHVVNGIPAPGSFHPVHLDSGNGGTTELAPAAQCSTMSSVPETDVSPASVASNNHFPFTPSEISGMGVDASAVDANFSTDLVGTGILQLEQDGVVGSSRGSLKSLSQFWNLSFSDFTADMTNLGDLEVLGDYSGSPFLSSDPDILFNSSEQDDIVEEYFADTVQGLDTVTGPASQSDEEKS
ncbi:Angiotensin-converting enzyme 2 protein [Dioscorea alata]|uniref:Angiotensin-converting enzyme 2 protein n=1 Tax=Dioscorea alata TaxID=55571 RepID=A0ACB7W3Z1_DIOAL|nr:Angiotensin-converting enzyme 2 protein [Dioscorea alata]